MTASGLTERGTIERKLRVSNGRGGFTDAGWAEVDVEPRTWANIVGLTGDESITLLETEATSRWRVKMRKRRDVNVKARLRWLQGDGEEVLLNIISRLPDPNEPRSKILLICQSNGSEEASGG